MRDVRRFTGHESVRSFVSYSRVLLWLSLLSRALLSPPLVRVVRNPLACEGAICQQGLAATATHLSGHRQGTAAVCHVVVVVSGWLVMVVSVVSIFLYRTFYMWVAVMHGLVDTEHTHAIYIIMQIRIYVRT